MKKPRIDDNVDDDANEQPSQEALQAFLRCRNVDLIDEARGHLDRAADLGNTTAMYIKSGYQRMPDFGYFPDFIKDPYGTKRDHSVAFVGSLMSNDLLERAASLGHPLALVDLYEKPMFRSSHNMDLEKRVLACTDPKVALAYQSVMYHWSTIKDDTKLEELVRLVIDSRLNEFSWCPVFWSYHYTFEKHHVLQSYGGMRCLMQLVNRPKNALLKLNKTLRWFVYRSLFYQTGDYYIGGSDTPRNYIGFNRHDHTRDILHFVKCLNLYTTDNLIGCLSKDVMSIILQKLWDSRNDECWAIRNCKMCIIMESCITITSPGTYCMETYFPGAGAVCSKLSQTPNLDGSHRAHRQQSGWNAFFAHHWPRGMRDLQERTPE